MQSDFPNQASYDLWKILHSAAMVNQKLPLGVFSLFVECMEPQNELNYESQTEREIEF